MMLDDGIYRAGEATRTPELPLGGVRELRLPRSETTTGWAAPRGDGPATGPERATRRCEFAHRCPQTPERYQALRWCRSRAVRALALLGGIGETRSGWSGIR